MIYVSIYLKLLLSTSFRIVVFYSWIDFDIVFSPFFVHYGNFRMDHLFFSVTMLFRLYVCHEREEYK